MDWCGRVGEVKEIFRSEWSVGYHWVVPKIFSMPDRIGPVYYSPPLKFLNTTWYFGIYKHSRIGDDDWIGFDIRRSTDRNPMPVRFSVGLMQADKSECLLHRNQNFSSRDSVCSINEFLLKPFLVKAKDKLAPSDELIVTCVIWPDVPSPGECKEFWHREQNMNSGGEAENVPQKAERKDSVTEDVSVPKYGRCNMETAMKSIIVSNMPAGNDDKLREISARDDWVVYSLPSKMTRNDSSPELSCGRRKYGDRSLSEPALSSKKFCNSAQHRNSRGEAHSDKKATRRHTSVTVGVPVTEDEGQCVETETKSIAVSDKPSGNDGTFREISRGVEWDIPLPPSKTTWDVLSPEFTCGRMKYHFSMYSSELQSDDIYLGFIVNISSDANFPLPIRWRMGVKRKDLAGLRWVMNGKMTAHGECFQHAQEICIKRSALESALSSDARLTFVHYVSIGEVDGEKEVSTQTDKTEVSQETQTENQIGEIANLEDIEEELRLCQTHPEEGEYVRLIQKKSLDARIEKFLSEHPRDDKKYFLLAA